MYFGHLKFPNVSTSNSLRRNPSHDHNRNFGVYRPKGTLDYRLLGGLDDNSDNVRLGPAERCKNGLIQPGYL